MARAGHSRDLTDDMIYIFLSGGTFPFDRQNETRKHSPRLSHYICKYHEARTEYLVQ